MIRKVLMVLCATVLLAAPCPAHPQTGDADGARNTQQARAALNAMVQALGGQAWLDMKNQLLHGFVAAFYHGNPSSGTTEYWDYHAWPDKDRIEFTRHRDVLQFYLGRVGSEVTYRGKNPLPQDQVDDFLRRRDHSIETAIKVWLKDPQTIFIDEGMHMVERREGEQVTLISPQNEAITIVMDTQSHLPLSSSFQWRDPVYHDRNTETEEYDNYHMVDGFPTAYSITRYKNGEMTRQYYVRSAAYNQTLPSDFWDPDPAARRIKK